MSTPCIITVAITGSVPTKKDSPAVPVTVPEQIESTHAAYEAGAAILYLARAKPTRPPMTMYSSKANTIVT